MSVPARRPAVLGATRGVLLAVCAAVLSVTAHRLADGGLPDPAMTVLLTGLFGWTATALARKARGTVATITLLGAAQLVMHLLLTTLAGHDGTTWPRCPAAPGSAWSPRTPSRPC